MKNYFSIVTKPVGSIFHNNPKSMYAMRLI